MELIDYLHLLRKRWLTVAVALLCCVGAAAGFTARQTRIYSSTVKFFVSGAPGQTSPTSVLDLSGVLQDRIGSYVQLATTGPVETSAAQQAGAQPGDHVSVSSSAVGGTVIFSVTVQASRRAAAHDVAAAYGTVLPAAIEQFEAPNAGTSSPIKAIVLEPPGFPGAPISPHPTRNLAGGAVLGLILGLGLALLFEALDTRLKTSEDIQKAANYPVIGAIPVHDRNERVIAATQPRSLAAEAFRQVRTNVQFAAVDDPLRSIIVTSASPGEGKTTLTVNLAITLAAAGTNVLLVDADLRRPQVSEALGIEGAVGLTSVLIGAVPLEDALQQWGGGLLTVLPSGPIPPNPAELLASSAMTDLVSRLEEKFDMVLFDSPPLLPVTDPAVLASKVSGVVVAVRVGETTRDRVRRAMEALARSNGRVIGMVANGFAVGRNTYYVRHYRYDPRGETMTSDVADWVPLRPGMKSADGSAASSAAADADDEPADVTAASAPRRRSGRAKPGGSVSETNGSANGSSVDDPEDAVARSSGPT